MTDALARGVELSGTWLAAPADDDLRRQWADPAFEPTSFVAVDVPGHWQSHPDFADHQGPVLYRRSFEADPSSAPGERAWIELEGTFYQGDVWFDGLYLGNTEGYFHPHKFEVTEHLTTAREHTLAVEVTCSPVSDPASKRGVTGPWLHGDLTDPGYNPGGLWRPVRLRRTGPVTCRRLRVLCTEATPQQATLTFDATLDTTESGSISVRTLVAGVEHDLDQPLAAGENRVRWSVTVPNPKLWWPRTLGSQPLHEVTVTFSAPRSTPTAKDQDRSRSEASVSDSRTLRVGFRRVTMRNWTVSVNGERLFLKGASLLPTRQDLANATAEDVVADVSSAVDLGLDVLRVHAHIARPELYEAADAAGMLLWQDLPLQGGYNRSVRRQAINQARAAVDLLGHHPSIAIWCGHDEPFAHPVDPSPRSRPSFTVTRLVAAQELPTWNRTVLDSSIRRALSGADPTRPVAANSGVLPHPPQFDGTASHFSFGWHHGDTRDLALAARAIPRVVRFVSRLGAPAVPTSADFCAPQEWPTLDWERLEAHHGYDAATFSRRVPPAAFPTFAEWQRASQELQAELIRRQVEILRRLKYRPTGGVIVCALADAHPSIGWGVLDHRRLPKLGHGALAKACAPVIVVADLPPLDPTPGDRLDLDVHVVNDLRAGIHGARLDASLAGPGVDRKWLFEGDVAPDAVALVGHLDAVLPEQHGAFEIKLELRYHVGDQQLTATNAYRFTT